mmetsp:Transcript_66664/g.168081  ORF Transcript_66664/g.168081 Transcript_66664/m.168081 type:complete len:230 (-) Transcript_66664:584-1273(-)
MITSLRVKSSLSTVTFSSKSAPLRSTLTNNSRWRKKCCCNEAISPSKSAPLAPLLLLATVVTSPSPLLLPLWLWPGSGRSSGDASAKSTSSCASLPFAASLPAVTPSTVAVATPLLPTAPPRPKAGPGLATRVPGKAPALAVEVCPLRRTTPRWSLLGPGDLASCTLVGILAGAAALPLSTSAMAAAAEAAKPCCERLACCCCCCHAEAAPDPCCGDLGRPRGAERRPV